MLICGAPDLRDDHAEVCCELALGMLLEASNVIAPFTKQGVNVRMRLLLHMRLWLTGARRPAHGFDWRRRRWFKNAALLCVR
jgi:hypothetical protein